MDAGSARYPSLARARFSQIVVGLIGLFCAMDITVVSLLVEPIKADLHLTDVQVGLVQTTSFYAAYGCLAVPMGILADRRSRVRMLVVAMVLWCGGLLMVGLSHGLWLLAAAKGLMGVALAMTYPAAMSLLADSFPPERRSFASISVGLGQDLGAGAGLLVGGVGYSALVAMTAGDPSALGGIEPWRAVSLIFAALGLLLIPAVIVLREPERMERRSGATGSWRELAAHRSFLLPLFIGMMAMGGLVSALRAWFAPALMRLYALQPGEFASWLSAIMLIAGLSGHLLSGKLVDMTNRSGGHARAMRLAAAAALFCVPASFVATVPAVSGFAGLASVFMIASGVAVAIPVIVINLRMPNELRGLTMGLYVVLLSLAGMAGAPMVGYVSEAFGGESMLGWALAVVGAPCALVAALAFWSAARPGVKAGSEA